ncbi:MAG: glycosyltransferase [Acidimicrobiales bacterium]
METVQVRPRDPRRFAEIVGPERSETFASIVGGDAVQQLRGRRVINVNSTAAGGGVAEMLHVLLGYVVGSGIEASWLVIQAEPDFFDVTKRLHNHLYGGPGDGGPLGPDEQAVYRSTLAPEGDALAAHVRPGDIVILHDPQTAGLSRCAKDLGCHVVWRCHVGIEEQNEHSRLGWDFLRPHLEPFVDRYVFTDRRFRPDWVGDLDYFTIWPSIDPFSSKNQEMSQETVEAILTHVGLIAGRGGDRRFVRSNGSTGTVERVCDIVRAGPAPGPETPLIVQISRWDVMKDMIGVMDAFAAHVSAGREAELVLAGPVVAGVADDPEGILVLQDCWNHWRELPYEVRHRVQLVCMPMDDVEENAAIVNALQRHAAVVTQKSIAEGFGLTIAEAMLKGTPVVGSAVGGIVHQVIDGETGRLIADPFDHAGFGAALCEILDDNELRHRLGEGASARALETHLGDTHLERWLQVINSLTTGDVHGKS